MTILFESADGVLRDASSGARWQLCPHLAPLLAALLRRPASVTGVSTAWTRTDLAVAIDAGPALSDLTSIVELPRGVEPWSNDDTHYAVEHGLLCTACKHAISWPQGRQAC